MLNGKKIFLGKYLFMYFLFFIISNYLFDIWKWIYF